MPGLDFNKNVIEYFDRNFSAEYILIDLYDFTDGYFELKDNKNVKVCCSIAVNDTIEEMKKNGQDLFNKKISFTVSLTEFDSYISKYSELLKSKYREENIIVNQFDSCRYYTDENNKMIEYENADFYKQKVDFCNKLTEILKKYLPNSKYISPYKNPLGKKDHYLGLNPVHYNDEVYKKQAEKICRILSN